MTSLFRASLFCFCFILSISFSLAQTICSNAGNLIIYSNYDGGIVTIDIDADIPDLKIGICTYEPVNVTLTGAFLANVTQVIYAGYNSMQNNNNCNQGNFVTSITGIPLSKIKINAYPEIGYENPNGHPKMVGVAGACNANTYAGGGNTPDQVVYYFQQATGGTLYAHFTQYQCWRNDNYKISNGGNCCVLPNSTVPVASFAASETEICKSACIDFTNTSTGGPFNDFEWIFEGGNPSSSSEESPTVCYAASGTYNVSLTVNGNSGAHTITRNGFVTVNEGEIFVSGFSFTESVCINGPDVTPVPDEEFTPGGIWSAGPGLSIDPQTGLISSSNSLPGSYMVTYTLNSSGCNASGNSVGTYELTVDSLPEIDIKPSGNVLLCEEDELVLNAPPGLLNYAWQGADGSQPVLKVSEPGIYFLTTVTVNGCSINSDTAFVTAHENPRASFSYTQNDGYTVQFTNTSEGGFLNRWYFPFADTSLTENPLYDFLYDDSWPVRLIVENSCGSDTLDTNVVVIKTGIFNLSESLIKVAEQDGVLHIQLNEMMQEGIIRVFSMSGQILVQQQVYTSGGNTFNFPVNKLVPGIYLLQIITPHQSGAIKWLKD